MAKKNIASVGLYLPQEEIEYVELSSKKSLLEYDIVFFYPDMGEFFASDNYNGVRCYAQSESAVVSDVITHWRTQLHNAYSAGRTIIVFLPAKKDFYVHTGEKNFSGTGRSRVTTNIVSISDNYKLIPIQFSSLTTAEGTRTEFASDYEPLKEHWAILKGLFVYRAYFDHASAQPVLNVKATKNMVAARMQNDAGGSLLVMPDFAFDFVDEWIELEAPEGTDAEREEPEGDWSPRSLQAGNALIRFALSADAWAKGGAEALASPEWANHADYTLPLEEDSLLKIADIEGKIGVLKDQLGEQNARLSASRKAKALLYGKGPPLESAVRDFFQALDIDAQQEVGPNIEFDVVFTVNDIKVIGEVEGKDNKAIAVDKISQLERCIQEDFAREETTTFAKGILFGNAFRVEDPALRGAVFTDKVVSASLRSGIVLVDTRELFSVLRTVMRTGNAEAGREFVRQMIAHPGGLFPPQY